MVRFGGDSSPGDKLRRMAAGFKGYAKSQGVDGESATDDIRNGVAETMVNDIVPLAKAYAPKDSGELRESIDWRENFYSDRLYRAELYSDKEYAAIHEYGSQKGAYTITPKEQPVLSFYWGKLGKRVAFQYVQSPPIREKRFMRDALEFSEENLKDNIRENIQDSIQEFS